MPSKEVLFAFWTLFVFCILLLGADHIMGVMWVEAMK